MEAHRPGLGAFQEALPSNVLLPRLRLWCLPLLREGGVFRHGCPLFTLRWSSVWGWHWGGWWSPAGLLPLAWLRLWPENWEVRNIITATSVWSQAGGRQRVREACKSSLLTAFPCRSEELKSWRAEEPQLLLRPPALLETTDSLTACSEPTLFLRLIPQTQAIWNIPKPYLSFSQTISTLFAMNSGWYQKIVWRGYDIIKLFQVENHYRRCRWSCKLTAGLDNTPDSSRGLTSMQHKSMIYYFSQPML